MRYNVITIEREFASGGSEIARLLSEKTGFQVHDRGILNEAAKNIGSSVEHIGHMDEKVHNRLSYSMYAMSRIGRTFDGDSFIPKENRLQDEEERLIKQYADIGDCIIVGRCAGHILSERTNVLRIFITADMKIRRKRAIDFYGADPKTAHKLLKFHDKNRAMYYDFYSDKAWDDRSEYHLILDSGKLGFERCADIISAAIR